MKVLNHTHSSCGAQATAVPVARFRLFIPRCLSAKSRAMMKRALPLAVAIRITGPAFRAA
jgi:hypothetical protein